MIETPTDKPRSQTPKTPSPGAPPSAQLTLRWSAAATRALTAFDAALTRRALGVATRAAVNAALSNPPLYPALLDRLRAENSPCQIDVSFVDDAAIAQLNAQHRGKDKPTDVLSFPVWEGEAFPFPPDQSEVALGDMIISIETAARQARELGHDLRAELAFLSIHGALHLLGYDHDNGGARRRMFVLQDQIFERVREEKGF